MRKLAFILIVLLPTLASAAVPPEGVPLKVRRGFFVETDIGGFMTLLGNDGYSNLQIYLQLGIGYDITENLELGLHVGIGANAANCWAGRLASGACTTSDNFTVTFIDLSFAYLFRIAERLYVAPKVVGGLTLLDPAPTLNAAGVGVTLAPNAGVGVGVEYATNVDHFTVGLDVIPFRFIIGPNIWTLQFYARVKYTF